MFHLAFRFVLCCFRVAAFEDTALIRYPLMYLYLPLLLTTFVLFAGKSYAKLPFRGAGLGDNGNYIVSQEPMEYSKAEEYCKRENCTLANLTGEKAANAAFLALHQYVGPSTLWCGWASMKSQIPNYEPVFRTWNTEYYGPDVDHKENYNYVICEKGLA